MIFFYSFLGIVILQRIIELFIARRNAKILFSKGALEYDINGYRIIVMMHAAFFISLVTEKLVLNPYLNAFLYPLIVIFLLAQSLRYWAISSLGEFWNTHIIILKDEKLISRGPYKYFPHPNYAAVITEIAVIPLIFSCYITAITFSILNILALSRRIRIENTLLAGNKNLSC